MIKFLKKYQSTILMVVGFFLISFPLLSNIIYSIQMSNLISSFKSEVKNIDQLDLKKMYEEADLYNKQLYTMNNTSVLSNMPQMVDYFSLLNLNKSGVMGTVSIPSISVNLPIYHGTDESVLSIGAGHVQQSSLPIGGQNTRAVISAHTGLPTANLFTRLDELEKNDLFYIDTCNGKLAYKVRDIKVINPEDISSLDIEPDCDLVSLVTCYPYGINNKRLVVTGERTEYLQKEFDQIKKKNLPLRELIIKGLPFIFIAIVVVKYIKKKRKVK